MLLTTADPILRYFAGLGFWDWVLIIVIIILFLMLIGGMLILSFGKDKKPSDDKEITEINIVVTYIKKSEEPGGDEHEPDPDHGHHRCVMNPPTTD